METLNREEIERDNRTVVPLKNKVRFVVWFVLCMLVLTAIGVWKWLYGS